MGAPDLSKAYFAALLELAEARFYASHRKELRPERDRRIGDLKNQSLTSGVRAVFAMRIYRELWEREVLTRICFYATIARESANSEMLSKRCFAEYKQLVIASVVHSAAALKRNVERDVRAAGDMQESALPNVQRYVRLQAEILDVVNAELRVLEAEGKLQSEPQPNLPPDREPVIEPTPVTLLSPPPLLVGGGANARVLSTDKITVSIKYCFPSSVPVYSLDFVKIQELSAARIFN